MSRKLMILFTMLVSALAGAVQTGACGDKFLVGLRGGPQLSFAGAIQPTRILVYWQADPAEDPESDGPLILEAALERAGHSVAIAHDPSAFYQEAASGSFDVILMEINDARSERERLKGVSPRSTVLPVTYLASGRERRAIKEEFGLYLNTPAPIEEFLRQIERARAEGR